VIFVETIYPDISWWLTTVGLQENM